MEEHISGLCSAKKNSSPASVFSPLAPSCQFQFQICKSCHRGVESAVVQPKSHQRLLIIANF